MKRGQHCLFFICLVLLVKLVKCDCGIYVSSKGDIYNTTSLTTPTGYAIGGKDSYGNYYFNFCRNLGQIERCNQITSPSIQTVSGFCQIIGYLPGVLSDHPTNPENGFQLRYTNTANDFCSQNNVRYQRTLNIIVSCNKLATTPVLVLADEISFCSYEIQMQSIYGCPINNQTHDTPSNPNQPDKPNDTKSSKSSTKKYISGGTIFIIVLFSSSTLYLVGGVAWNFFIKGKKGKQTIPNLAFWTEVLSLVIDGYYFMRFKFTGKVKIDYSKVSQQEVY